VSAAATECTAAVQVEKTTTHDIYTGTAPALIEAGVIQQSHLEPQPGRRKGSFGFMPDGRPVPEGIGLSSSLPGSMVIQIRSDGRGEVRRAVALDERRRREDAASTLIWQTEHAAYYRGTRERLLRDGIPESWLAGLPQPGKKRGWRTHYDGERKIDVTFSESGFTVETRHIEGERHMGRDYYLRKRAEYGLPLIVRGHLSLVWCAPEARTSARR
jgi:hypothetical protein